MSAPEYDRCIFDWKFRHLTITVEVCLKLRCVGNHDHVEIRSLSPERHPLPITETGYKSHWPAEDEFASVAEAARAVSQWLDERAKDREWLDYVCELEQPTLF